MSEKKAEKEELRRFLEEKINELKKELEYYEYLLALLESNFMKPFTKSKGRESDVIEVKVNRKTVGIISRNDKLIKLRLLFDAPRDPEIIAFLKKQINLLDPQSNIEFEDEKSVLRSIIVSDFAGGNALTSGIIEILRIAVIELYRKTPKK